MTEQILELAGIGIPNASAQPWQVTVTCQGTEPIDSALAMQVVHSTVGAIRATAVEVAAADLAEQVAGRVPCSRVEVRVRFDGGTYTVRQDGHPSVDGMPVEAVSRTAVIAMDSALPNAAQLMRATIVAIDGIPGTQVEGISPLYHVQAMDGAAGNSAVIAIRTTMHVGQLETMLRAMHEAHEGAVRLRVVDVDGASPAERDRLDGQAARSAAVLAPWLDMDPDATLDGDPLAFLLASAPDAPFVGMESDHWIIGDTQ